MRHHRWQRSSKKGAMSWLKTAQVKHDGWTLAKWVEYYNERGVAAWNLTDGTLGLWYDEPSFNRKGGYFYNNIELWFPGPHAVENVVDFFGEAFDEARCRFTFIRSPHNDIAVLVYTRWKPTSEHENPFETREHLFDYRLSVKADDPFILPPKLVDHRKCYGHTPNCPGEGTGHWELINDAGIGEMPNLIRYIYDRAEEIGWAAATRPGPAPSPRSAVGG